MILFTHILINHIILSFEIHTPLLNSIWTDLIKILTNLVKCSILLWKFLFVYWKDLAYLSLFNYYKKFDTPQQNFWKKSNIELVISTIRPGQFFWLRGPKLFGSLKITVRSVQNLKFWYIFKKFKNFWALNFYFVP